MSGLSLVWRSSFIFLALNRVWSETCQKCNSHQRFASLVDETIISTAKAEIHRVSRQFRGEYHPVERQILQRFEVGSGGRLACTGLGAPLLGKRLVPHDGAVVQDTVQAVLRAPGTCRTKQNSDYSGYTAR